MSGWNNPEADAWWGDRGAQNPFADDQPWGDVAAERNREHTDAWRQPANPNWATPTAETGSWRRPDKAPRFHHAGDQDWQGDQPGRRFVARKRHGWWGPTEYFDPVTGQKIG